MICKNYVTSLLLLLIGGVAQAEEIRGVIRKIDPENKELVIEARGLRTRGLPMTFEIGRDTRILIGHETGKLADLQPGERVLLSYEPHPGKALCAGNHCSRFEETTLRRHVSGPGCNNGSFGPDRSR